MVDQLEGNLALRLEDLQDIGTTLFLYSRLLTLAVRLFQHPVIRCWSVKQGLKSPARLSIIGHSNSQPLGFLSFDCSSSHWVGLTAL